MSLVKREASYYGHLVQKITNETFEAEKELLLAFCYQIIGESGKMGQEVLIYV